MSLNSEALPPVVSATNKLRSLRFLLARRLLLRFWRVLFFSTIEGIADPYRHRCRCGTLPRCPTRDGRSRSGSANGGDAGKECARRRWPTFMFPTTSPPGCGTRYRPLRSSSSLPGHTSQCCRPGCTRLRSHRSWRFRRHLSSARP